MEESIDDDDTEDDDDDGDVDGDGDDDAIALVVASIGVDVVRFGSLGVVVAPTAGQPDRGLHTHVPC